VLSAEPAKQPTVRSCGSSIAIRPVLVEHCHKCHGEKKQWSNFRLDSGRILKGDIGPDSPNKPEESLLIRLYGRRMKTENAQGRN
jgi:hypothetical protein